MNEPDLPRRKHSPSQPCDCRPYLRPYHCAVPEHRFSTSALDRIDALEDLLRAWEPRIGCPQCGRRYRERACGPTHALVAALVGVPERQGCALVNRREVHEAHRWRAINDHHPADVDDDSWCPGWPISGSQPPVDPGSAAG